jgi:hypothetical protein
VPSTSPHIHTHARDEYEYEYKYGPAVHDVQYNTGRDDVRTLRVHGSTVALCEYGPCIFVITCVCMCSVRGFGTEQNTSAKHSLLRTKEELNPTRLNCIVIADLVGCVCVYFVSSSFGWTDYIQIDRCSGSSTASASLIVVLLTVTVLVSFLVFSFLSLPFPSQHVPGSRSIV